MIFVFLYFPDNPICSAHLINKGVTVTGNNATIEWEGTGPSATTVVSAFQCRLDRDAGGIYLPCKMSMCMWELREGEAEEGGGGARRRSGEGDMHGEGGGELVGEGEVVGEGEAGEGGGGGGGGREVVGGRGGDVGSLA